MQASPQIQTPSQDIIPDSSLDWRFLLPLDAGSRVLVIGGGQDDFTRLFGKMGISALTWLGDEQIQGAFDARTFPPAVFDVVAIPFGFPRGGALRELETYRVMHGWLRPGGDLLFGFPNLLGLKRHFGSASRKATLWGVRRRLGQAGFSQMSLFGAMPNLQAPEYILPLKGQAIGFAWQHRYRYKYPDRLLNLLGSRPALALLAGLFPCYYVTAKSGPGP